MSLKTIIKNIQGNLKYGKANFFIKSFFHNIRHYPFRYFVIFLSEVVMIVLSLCASGIMIDSIAGYNGADDGRKQIIFRFYDEMIRDDEYDKSIAEGWRTFGSLREKFNKFIEDCPIGIKQVLIYPEKNDHRDPDVMVWGFANYEDMTEFWTSTWPGAPLATREQFENPGDVCFVGTDHYPNVNYVFTDENHVLYGGKEYLVIGEIPGHFGLHMFLGSEPDSVKIYDVWIDFKDYPTERQANEVIEMFLQMFSEGIDGYGVVGVTSSPEDFGLLEVKMSFANIFITALIQVIAIFNVMLIFRYIVSMRKKEFAVYRLCGFSKRACILSSLCEIMCISLICSVISFAVFELIKPALAEQFSAVSAAFDFGYYLLILIGYLVLTAIIFTVYIAPALNKSVVNELKGGQAL